MVKLTGTNPDQVPTNADLGDMAYKDGENLQAGPLTITDGKVGVNNTDPTSPLYVEGTIQSRLGASGVQIYGTGGSGEVASVGSLPLVFNVNASPKMTILSSGNVGIGETSPWDSLVVSDGGVHFGTAPNSNNSGRLTYNTSSGLMVVSAHSTGGSTDMNFVTSNAGTPSTKLSINPAGEVKVTTGLLELNGNDIGGTQVTIADDAVASITPPRNGGFMFITAGLTGGNYPQQSRSGMIFFDAGASLEIQERITASALDVSTSDVTGTTGTDGNVTVAVQSGVIKIENRGGSTHVFDITFL
jgi:hypothetical protein